MSTQATASFCRQSPLLTSDPISSRQAHEPFQASNEFRVVFDTGEGDDLFSIVFQAWVS